MAAFEISEIPEKSTEAVTKMIKSLEFRILCVISSNLIMFSKIIDKVFLESSSLCDYDTKKNHQDMPPSLSPGHTVRFCNVIILDEKLGSL
jgi:hypothetical protein